MFCILLMVFLQLPLACIHFGVGAIGAFLLFLTMLVPDRDYMFSKFIRRFYKENESTPEFAHLVEEWYLVGFYVVFFLGIFIVIVGYSGIFTSFKRSSSNYFRLAVILGVILGLQYGVENTIRNGLDETKFALKKSMIFNMRYNNTNKNGLVLSVQNTMLDILHQIEKENECCGLSGPNDYNPLEEHKSSRLPPECQGVTKRNNIFTFQKGCYDNVIKMIEAKWPEYEDYILYTKFLQLAGVGISLILSFWCFMLELCSFRGFRTRGHSRIR